jgi:hypothetical protein
VFFLTDASGKRESRDTLKEDGRWLWFKPDVIMTLAHRRGGALEWYTRDTGGVRCSPDYRVHFGINRLGLVNVYAKDIALLPDWQQQLWAAYNVSPDGGVSAELLESQVEAEPAETQAPEAYLPRVISLLNSLASERLGFALFREHAQYRAIVAHAHRFRAIDAAGLYALAKDIARLTADSIDGSSLQKIVAPPKGTNWGSLKSLEKVLGLKVGADKARTILGPLAGAYELRLADAHLSPEDLSNAFQLVGIDPSQPFVNQGARLLASCVLALYEVAEVIKTIDPGATPVARS